MKRKKYKRNFLVSVETGLFKKPIITITDGKQEIKFERVGGFEVETDRPFPKSILKFFK